MSFIEILQDFQRLGCMDRIQTALACRVYENLLITKKYSDVEKCFCKELDLIYIFGKRDGRTHVFVPLLSSGECDLIEMELIQKKMDERHNNCVFHVAICDTGSNVLYYTMTPTFKDKEHNLQRKR